MLIEKLDDLFNGEMSVRRQKEAIEKKKKLKMEAKNRKQREQKKLAKELEKANKSQGSIEEGEETKDLKSQGDDEGYGYNPWEKKTSF